METKADDSGVIDSEHPARGDAEMSGLAKIRFPLPPEDEAAGVEAENLWAAALGDGRYRIDNIPFYAYGISLDDIVRAVEVGGRLVFSEVVSRGGHSTYRVLVSDTKGVDDAAFKRLWLVLETSGCAREVAKSRWVAIDVPPAADIFSVYDILESGEAEGIWTFEEGHCGHPTSRSP